MWFLNPDELVQADKTKQHVIINISKSENDFLFSFNFLLYFVLFFNIFYFRGYYTSFCDVCQHIK